MPSPARGPRAGVGLSPVWAKRGFCEGTEIAGSQWGERQVLEASDDSGLLSGAVHEGNGVWGREPHSRPWAEPPVGPAGTQAGPVDTTTKAPFFLHHAGDSQSPFSPQGWLGPLPDTPPGVPVSAGQQHLLLGCRYSSLTSSGPPVVFPVLPAGSTFWGGASQPRAVETAPTHCLLGGGEVQGPASRGGIAEVSGDGGLSGPQVSSPGLCAWGRNLQGGARSRGVCGALLCEFAGKATRGHRVGNLKQWKCVSCSGG